MIETFELLMVAGRIGQVVMLLVDLVNVLEAVIVHIQLIMDNRALGLRLRRVQPLLVARVKVAG